MFMRKPASWRPLKGTWVYIFVDIAEVFVAAGVGAAVSVAISSKDHNLCALAGVTLLAVVLAVTKWVAAGGGNATTEENAATHLSAVVPSSAAGSPGVVVHIDRYVHVVLTEDGSGTRTHEAKNDESPAAATEAPATPEGPHQAPDA